MGVFERLSRRALLKSGSLTILGLAMRDRLCAAGADGRNGEYAAFVNPPDSARPSVYWYFMDGHLEAAAMRADLESLKSAGLGGGVYLEVNIGIPPGPVKFMSEPWQQMVADAFGYADSLGLEMALGAGAGWCGAGGPWVKPEESMQFLETSVTRVHGPGKFQGPLPKPKSRTPFFGEETLTPELRKVWEEFYVDDYVLAFPATQGEEKTPDLEEKALYTRGSYSSQILGPFTKVPWVRPALPSHSEYPGIAVQNCVAAAKVQDLTRLLKKDDTLDWEIPEGEWIVMRAGRRITAQTTRPAPNPGLGWETNKFDPVAAQHHFDAYFKPLLDRIGNRRHTTTGLTTLHYDSWEMSSQNWSAQFASEFERRRGYALTSFLPAFAGFVVKDRATTERFLWDVRQTAQELTIANQAEALKGMGRKYGLQMALEPYDLDPCSDLELGRVADVPMAEFWSHYGQISTDWSVVESTSVGHTNGKVVIAAEAFTAEFPERWLQHPASMKSQGDWAFCAGINRIVFHRFQSQSGADKAPGMTMGPDGGYGVHWDRTQTWWDMSAAYHRYVTRCSAMLRRGLFVADVLYLAAEGAPNVFLAPPSAFQPGEFSDRWGHNFDGCAPGTLIARASVKDGEIAFPDGMKYRVLVLPQVETMTPELLKKVADLVETGATVVGMPPKASPSLSGHPDCDAQVRTIAKSLFGENTKERGIRKVGAGSVVFDTSAYHWAQANPLAEAQWIWAKGSNAPEANRGVRSFSRKFQVENAADLDIVEVLITASPGYEVSVNGSRLGGGNVIDQVRRMDATWLIHDGDNEMRVTVDCDSHRSASPFGVIASLSGMGPSGKRVQVVTDSSWTVTQTSSASGDAAVELGAFAASPWNLRAASLQAASVYPSYRITARLLADLGVRPDFEGEGMRAIHRRDGEQDLYFVSNRKDRELSTSWAFRVTGKQPEWWDAISGERHALQQFEEKEGRTHIPIRLDPHESGFVVFSGSARQKSGADNFPRLRQMMSLDGSWEVTFDPKWGGPGSVSFDRLEDWAKRSEDGIRHYSGKAVYKIRFDAEDIGNRNLVLSLGEVRNIAAARLNGQELGVAWCAPWRLALPERVLRARGNELEITVANLWWNRLVRDSSLPEAERLTWIPGKYPFNGNEKLQPSGLLGPVRIDMPDV
ncbi:MAG: hypothetical protein JST28_17595 [Acidobacteria bacterium]|nr:hypothetical protein [Acidobacteriota bacterium]